MDRKCPKCGSNAIVGPYKVENESGKRATLSIRLLRSASLRAYACAECAYVEMYTDTKGLRNLKKFGHFKGRTRAFEEEE